MARKMSLSTVLDLSLCSQVSEYADATEARRALSIRARGEAIVYARDLGFGGNSSPEQWTDSSCGPCLNHHFSAQRSSLCARPDYQPDDVEALSDAF